MWLSQKMARVRESSEVRIEKDEYLPGRFLPSQKNVLVGGVPVNINSLGLRGPEPAGKKVLIAAAGDSLTFGWSASSDAATYPAFLQQLFAAQGVEVLNAGMPRWNSVQVLNFYVTRLIPLKPRLVIFIAGWNDLAYELIARPVDSPGPFYQTFSSPQWLRILGQGFGNVKKRLGLKKYREDILAAREKGSDPVRWERFDEYERVLRSFVTLARSQGTEPVLVTLPHFLKENLTVEEKTIALPHLVSWPDMSYGGWERGIREINLRIRRVAEDQKAALAECEDEIPFRYFTDLAHLNDEGNRLFAQCIHKTIAPQTLS